MKRKNGWLNRHIGWAARRSQGHDARSQAWGFSPPEPSCPPLATAEHIVMEDLKPGEDCEGLDIDGGKA